MSAAIARRYFVRAHAELVRGEHESAAESFRAAMDLIPGFLSARLGYAAALVRLGDMPRASQVLRAGLARVSTDRARAVILQNLGDVLIAGGDFFGAEDAYRQVLEIAPGTSAASAGLARVHAKLGRYAESFAGLLAAARASS